MPPRCSRDNGLDFERVKNLPRADQVKKGQECLGRDNSRACPVGDSTNRVVVG